MNCVTNSSTRTFSRKVEILVFLFPLFFILCAFLIWLYSRPLYQQLFGILEQGLFEWVQFLCYVGSALVGLITFQIFRKKPYFVWQKYVMLLFVLGCTFIAGEEVSWGQHIFKWVTPESFAQINLQKETNLHNLTIIQGNSVQHKAFIVIGWYGGLSWLLRRKSGSLTLKDLVLTEWFICSYFLPLALFYTQIELFGRGNGHQETFETVLSFGFLAIAIVNLRKTRKANAEAKNCG